MIRPRIVGFDIFDANGKHVAKVLSFGEAVELSEKHDPPQPPGPSVESVDESHSRQASPYSKTWSSKAMAIPSTQIDSFNEAARRAGTGARYIPDKDNPNFANCECDSKRSRAREMKSRGMFDKESYGLGGDYAGT